MINLIEKAIEDLRAGRMIILVDDENRENEGDLVVAAEHATPEIINFMLHYGRGLICMPMANEIIDRLKIPAMVVQNQSKYGTAFTASIGAATGMTTGISAYDRSHTIQVAVNPNSTAADIVSPGHMFPLRAREGGVLERAGHTEGCIDLMRIAGLKPAAALCEIMNDDGTMARLPELKQFAIQHRLTIISIADIINYRYRYENLIKEIASVPLPLHPYGSFTFKIFVNILDGTEYMALINESEQSKPSTLVRIHSECLTGDVFGSARCDCGWQLEQALTMIGREGGVLLYLRQEGRGIGLANKIKAYALQDQGMDTVEANLHLGFAPDQRDYRIVGQLLRNLNIDKVRLLTNNPAKVTAMEQLGIEVSARVALEMAPTKTNFNYLQTKQQKLGHLLSLGSK